MGKHTSVDEYIASYPDAIQPTLQKVRRTIQEALPEATEAISYDMPVFKLGRNIIYFGGWKEHISVYPVPHAKELQAEMEPYIAGRGTLKFKLGEAVPYDLITKVAKQLAKEITAAKE